ncbi:n-acetylglucosaminylphosphatidylinositol de-n-acetylase family protein [Vairimorpha apis BRL 01]|uniref:N-acetylglucosaminylphosphatidylinositol deacetylase n=1 Tax=Vairimorpha apis BRL 01 TaxID=1037528 RepID=T0KZV4_9MICR|nr:n-acetylglucosaminylphosphatidylinositol de-n-acetylase family protein [Vairimorpha apis BRL 01]
MELINMCTIYGSELEFKVKKNITFRKILKTYAENVHKNPNELRLIFNGKVLNLDETPDFRNMEDGDELEVAASQVGGSKINKQIYDDNYQVKKALCSSCIIFNLVTVILFYFNGRFNFTKMIISSIPEIIVIMCILKISKPSFKYENNTIELVDPGTSLTKQGIPSLLSSYNYYNYVSGNYLLLVAHPDDESMFFAPTLLNLKGRIRILCLSKGNTQFVYSKRELEMIKLCKNYNFELILYNFFDNDKWDENVISDILEYTFLTSPFKTLITFDNFGVSYHQNHISCFLGAEKFRNNKSSRPNFHIQFWYLNSKNLFTKYILNFSKNDFILGFDNYFQALVGITSFDNLRAVETEKKHKYDLLANHCGAMNGYKTRIIPYSMTWEGITTTFHKKYRSELNLDSRTQAYIQARVLKMTLESLSMEARRGEVIMENEQEVTEKENLESNMCENRPISISFSFDILQQVEEEIYVGIIETEKVNQMLSHDYMRRHNEALRCIHLQLCLNYGLTKSKKIRNHSLQECRANKSVEIRVDTRIPTSIKVKYNKPDVFILDKIKKEILIVEHKYDLLANHCGAMNGYKTRIIPYVMAWEGITTTFHKKYRSELNLDSRTQAYIQARVLKMTLESLSMEARRGEVIMENEQENNFFKFI